MSFSRKNKYGTILVNMKNRSNLKRNTFSNIKSKILFAAIAISALIFGSCKEEEKVELSDDDTLTLEVYPSEETDFSGITNWHITNKSIQILFGYDFN